MRDSDFVASGFGALAGAEPADFALTPELDEDEDGVEDDEWPDELPVADELAVADAWGATMAAGLLETFELGTFGFGLMRLMGLWWLS